MGRQRQSVKEKKGYEFYKIIHASNIQNQCIRLPPKFVRKFSSDLSAVAFLKVPKGKKWNVELRTTGRELFFYNGWQDFVDYYSILTGHLLVFKYVGNSIFRVVIFDMTGSEISYPDNFEKTEELKRDEEFNASDCTAKEHIPSKEKEDTGVMPVVKTQSRTKAYVKWRSSVVPREKNGLIRQSSALRLKHPSFTVVIKSSFRGCLTIPSQFADSYIKDDLKSLTLEVSDGRRWRVGCLVYEGKCAYLSKGLATFAKENSIKEGDVCVFEMIKKDAFLKVHIFHIKNMAPSILKIDGQHSSEKQKNAIIVPFGEVHSSTTASPAKRSVVTAHQEKGASGVASELRVNHPSFTVVMERYNLKCFQIPSKFARKYMKCHIKSVTLEGSDGRKWIIGCSQTYRSIGGLSSGWVKFVRENSLKEGNTCSFQMINDTSLKVSISHDIRNKNTPLTIVNEL